jgi:hypothetical protein
MACGIFSQHTNLQPKKTDPSTFFQECHTLAFLFNYKRGSFGRLPLFFPPQSMSARSPVTFTTLEEFRTAYNCRAAPSKPLPEGKFDLEEGDGLTKPKYWIRALVSYKRCQQCCLFMWEGKRTAHKCVFGHRQKHSWTTCPIANMKGIPPPISLSFKPPQTILGLFVGHAKEIAALKEAKNKDRQKKKEAKQAAKESRAQARLSLLDTPAFQQNSQLNEAVAEVRQALVTTALQEAATQYAPLLLLFPIFSSITTIQEEKSTTSWCCFDDGRHSNIFYQKK